MSWSDAKKKYSDASWKKWKMVNCPIRCLWLRLGFISKKDVVKYG